MELLVRNKKHEIRKVLYGLFFFCLGVALITILNSTSFVDTSARTEELPPCCKSDGEEREIEKKIKEAIQEFEKKNYTKGIAICEEIIRKNSGDTDREVGLRLDTHRLILIAKWEMGVKAAELEKDFLSNIKQCTEKEDVLIDGARPFFLRKMKAYQTLATFFFVEKNREKSLQYDQTLLQLLKTHREEISASPDKYAPYYIGIIDHNIKSQEARVDRKQKLIQFEKEYQSLLDQTSLLIQERKIKHAVELCEQFLNKYKDSTTLFILPERIPVPFFVDVEIRYLKGQLYEKVGNPKEAKANYKATLERLKQGIPEIIAPQAKSKYERMRDVDLPAKIFQNQ